MSIFPTLLRQKARVMPVRTVRARVHAGHLEPLEDLALIEGSEITITVAVQALAKESQYKAPVKLGSYPLGAPSPLTRAMIYEDVG